MRCPLPIQLLVGVEFAPAAFPQRLRELQHGCPAPTLWSVWFPSVTVYFLDSDADTPPSPRAELSHHPFLSKVTRQPQRLKQRFTKMSSWAFDQSCAKVPDAGDGALRGQRCWDPGIQHG